MTWLLGPVLFFMTVAMAGGEAVETPEPAQQTGPTNAPALELEPAGPKAVYWSAVKERNRVAPIYPPGARALDMEGDCAVVITLDVDGVPTSAVAEPCDAAFRASATAAALASRFYPYVLDGEPTAVKFTYNYRFRLTDRPTRPKPKLPPFTEIPPFMPFARVGVLDTEATRHEAIEALGPPDRRAHHQLYWGCEDHFCLAYGMAVALDAGTISSAEVQTLLDPEQRKVLFPESDLPARVLGLTEEQVTTWVGRAPSSRKWGRVQWEWVADGAPVRMSVSFQAGLVNAATWYL